MTVHYARRLANPAGLGNRFIWLLFRWRGSVYKLIWREYIFFLAGYFVISAVYRYGLSLHQQKAFEKLIKSSQSSLHQMELSFVLGFFVTSIVSNWWTLCRLIPWPDPVALLINVNIIGNTESTLFLKKTILRYCNLSLLLTFRHISPLMRRKFPKLQNVVTKGLLLEHERIELERANSLTNHGVEWMPIKWATEIVVKAQANRHIASDYSCHRILQELDKFRHECTVLREYDVLLVPLVYIQAATLCVYTYFGTLLVAGQWLIEREGEDRQDFYLPFMSTLQFLFYMGWLKVAEVLINPFGSDDDDFELDKIMDRHIQVSNMMIGTNVDVKMDNSVVPVAHISKDNFQHYAYLLGPMASEIRK